MVLEKPIIQGGKYGNVEVWVYLKGKPRRGGEFLVNTIFRCHFVSVGTAI